MQPRSTGASYALKNALYQAALILFENDENLEVSFGHPGFSRQADDIIAFTGIRTEQQPGPQGTQRSRDETVHLKVLISCWRAGEADNDRVPTDAVYKFMGRLEEYVRVTDTTLGGNCTWCFLSSHDSSGTTDPQILAKGRLVEAEVEFTASVRISTS